MSKISERLSKLGHTERSGFGFGAQAASTKIPVILVGVNVEDSKSADGIDADLFIVAPGKNGAAQADAVKGANIWGVSVSGGSATEIDAAVEAGADFIIATGESAPGAALRDDDTAKGFIVASDVGEDRSKAIDSGQFEFLILDGTKIDLPLTVGSVLDIQEQLEKYSGHIFLQVTEIPDQANLELLRDIGISVLLYDGKNTKREDISALRKTIEQIEPKKHKNSGSATLPRASAASEQDDHEDHGEDFDDDEDWE
ncbi:hypothetical protein JYU04_00495 [Dehalococcoides mccartyi]|nr:hypothetical protein [Dehalococcoides mccartyi]